MRIGLYGGSFNPPHTGHRLVATAALRRLGLDAVWWLVTPGNPLKNNAHLAPLAERLAAVAQLANHPAMVVSALEAPLGARYSIQTIRYLIARCPGVRFVWLIGADSLVSFHRWKDWRAIARLLPIAVVDRPGATLAATAGQAGQWLVARRMPHGADLLAHAPPAFTVLYGPRSALSSTELRRQAHR